mgnify:CR=1 FL=1
MRTAAYARYSSDNQREASLDDQLRNCRAYCVRQGWPAPTVYQDAEISGSRTDRADYQRLLRDARQFDVILVDDLTRFGRDKEELGTIIKRLRFHGVRLIGVSDGIDTARKGYKVETGLRGLMSELFLDDLADKTHRGLTGRALAGASAGGLPFGYIVTETGQRAIDETKAAIVRRIYADYLAGRSPREIVSALNAERVPAPRGGQWHLSGVYGDVRRGLGILANPIYTGRQVWNRSHWIKHPDTGRRVRQERPPSEWITTEQPDLAIIDAATWTAAQARIRAASPKRTGDKQGGPGRPARYLLSGILHCDQCDGPMVIVDRYRYGCSRHKDQGDAVCTSRTRVPRALVEDALVAGVRAELLSDAAFRRYQRATAEALKRAAPDTAAAKRSLAAAEQVQQNIMAALRAGIITPSTRTELIAAEAAVTTATSELQALQSIQPTHILPRARERWNNVVARLTDTRDIPAARDALRELIGNRVTVKNENGELFAEIAASECQIKLVAGAGFEPATFGL